MNQDSNACRAGQEAQGMEPKEPRTFPARPINCDQVAWMLSAIGRYLPPSNAPAVSRAREMQKYALLYEIMEVAHLHFEDDGAQHNGTPPDVRRFRCASKCDQYQHESGRSLFGVLASSQREGAQHG